MDVSASFVPKNMGIRECASIVSSYKNHYQANVSILTQMIFRIIFSSYGVLQTRSKSNYHQTGIHLGDEWKKAFQIRESYCD